MAKAKEMLFARAMPVKTIGEREEEAKAARKAAKHVEITRYPGGTLISCRMPMGTRHILRGKHKNRHMLVRC